MKSQRVGSKRAAATAEPAEANGMAYGAIKKKNKALTLEQQVKALEDENLALRMQLKVGRESAKQLGQQKDELTAQIKKVLQEPEIDKTQLSGLLKSYVVRNSDWSADHVDTVDNHMVLIKRLLDPSKVTKLCLWTLSQEDDFFKPVLDSKESLYQILCEAIEATLDQVEEFKSYRQDARVFTKGLRFTVRECDDLRERLRRKQRALAEEMHELQDILTPEQLAKFIVWVNSNEELNETLKANWVSWGDVLEERKAEKQKKEQEERRSEGTSAGGGEMYEEEEDEEEDSQAS